jgi:hypothetical protein
MTAEVAILGGRARTETRPFGVAEVCVSMVADKVRLYYYRDCKYLLRFVQSIKQWHLVQKGHIEKWRQRGVGGGLALHFVSFLSGICAVSRTRKKIHFWTTNLWKKVVERCGKPRRYAIELSLRKLSCANQVRQRRRQQRTNAQSRNEPCP